MGAYFAVPMIRPATQGTDSSCLLIGQILTSYRWQNLAQASSSQREA